MNSNFKRRKTHILYSLNINSRKFYTIIFLSITILVTNYTYRFVENSIKPIITALAASTADTYATKTINDTIIEYLNTKIEYSDLCEISKSEDGEIESIEANIQGLNNIKTKILEDLIKKYELSEIIDISIPIGDITKSQFLLGRGPKIPIKLLTTGSPRVDFEYAFESAGINQTRHKISIVVSVEIEVILPYENVIKTVTTEMILCESIIIGKIPNVYVDK